MPKEPTINPAPLAVTKQVAAQVLSCSPRHINNLIARGELRAVKIGRFVRIAYSELERFAEGRAK